jgi:hypothetical protein
MNTCNYSVSDLTSGDLRAEEVVSGTSTLVQTLDSCDEIIT